MGNTIKELKIPIESGIKQGCTGSTTLFKLITYIIIKEMEEKGEGFDNNICKINTLFFADDGLQLSTTIEAATRNIKILTEISKSFGLEINKNKSNIIIYNMNHQPDNIVGIKVTNSIKYLGITNKYKKYFQRAKETYV